MATGANSNTQNGRSGTIVYGIALIAWGLAVAYWSLDLFDATPFGPDADPPPRETYLYLAAGSLGAALFSLLATRLFGRGENTASSGNGFSSLIYIVLASVIYYGVLYVIIDDIEDHLLQFVYFTPLYCGVLAIMLCLRRDWGFVQTFYFAFATSLAHLYAIYTAAEIFDEGGGSEELKMITLNGAYIFEKTFFLPGLAAGIVGAGLSFLALSPLSPGFRNLRAILGASLVLGVMGAVGLSIDLLTLYIPWQIVFGIIVAGLARRL